MTQTDLVILTDFPVPPTVNQSLMPFRGRLIHTSKSRDFEKKMIHWSFTHASQLVIARMKVSEWKTVRCNLYFGFHYSSLFTKKKEIKTLDVHNRIKAFHDRLGDLLKHDDKHIFAGDCEKAIISDDQAESVMAVIEPMVCRNFDEVKKSYESP